MLTTNQTQAQRLRRSHNSVDSSHSNDLMYNGVVKCELPYDPLSHDPLIQPDMLGRFSEDSVTSVRVYLVYESEY